MEFFYQNCYHAGLPIFVRQAAGQQLTKSSPLSSVGDEEVFVGPLLELGVELWVVLVAHLLVLAVEELDILLYKEAGGDVTA